MYEAHLHIGICVTVQQAIERVIADEGTGGIGHCAGKSGFTDGGGHFHNGSGGKICSRTVGDNIDNDNLISLCRYHHKMADDGKIPKKVLFDIVKEIENA